MSNKTVWGFIGVILTILGITGTIPLSLKGEHYVYGISITGIMIISGIILIAWAFSD